MTKLIFTRERRSLLEKCAATALNSKLLASHKDFFSKMVVDAVLTLDDDLNIDLIGIKKETGGALEVLLFNRACFNFGRILC